MLDELLPGNFVSVRSVNRAAASHRLREGTRDGARRPSIADSPIWRPMRLARGSRCTVAPLQCDPAVRSRCPGRRFRTTLGDQE
jgi:hypothetical protein